MFPWEQGGGTKADVSAASTIDVPEVAPAPDSGFGIWCEQGG